MATQSTRWLKSILVIITCVAAEGSHPPSNLVCFIPCGDSDCTVDIHCTWDQRPDNHIPTNYTLYWHSANSKEEHLTSGIRFDGLIPRKHAPRHEELFVWVRATNQDGYADSQKIVVNAENIIKPPPPKFSSSSHEPLEVHWNTVCGQLDLSIGSCEVRHRIQENETWLELEDGLQGSYTLMDPIPGTVYEFQVRCSCYSSTVTGLMSDWSAVHPIRSAELAPVGEVDVWRDCGMFPPTSDCYLTWKNLTASRARGVILGYEVRITYNNDTSASINESTSVPSGQFVYDGRKWHLSSPLNDVSSVSVSAHNALGATLPSYLALPLKDKRQNHQAIYLMMNEDNLNVSWDLPAQLSDNPKEYVVQYKEAGRPGGFGFDWIKVDKSKRAGFTGRFKKYTPYQVSLYQILHSGEVRHLTSMIGFSVEKAPPTVPSFNVSAVEENEVSLVWKPIPLTRQGGLVLYYQIGIGAKRASLQRVNNVSASLHHENKPFTMQRLHPGQEYEVWIRAVNAAGPGPNVTTRVTTKHRKDYALLIGALVGTIAIFMGICFIVVVLSACHRQKHLSVLLPRVFTEQVPDPNNSNIFVKMSQQMNEPFLLACIPISDQDPKISLLEIVGKKSQDFQLDGLTGPGVFDGWSQMDCPNTEMGISVKEGRDRPGCRRVKEEYSKMIDSNEDCHSSDEERFTSGYEQHFMPTAMEVMDL